MKKVLIPFFLIVLPFIVACGDDNDEPDVDSSEINGVWECVDCEVTDMRASGGIELPDFVKDLIVGNIEGDMVGSKTVISDDVKVSGNVIVFPGSGIKWKILKLEGKKMDVEYDTKSETGGYGISMTVKASYRKIG